MGLQYEAQAFLEVHRPQNTGIKESKSIWHMTEHPLLQGQHDNPARHFCPEGQGTLFSPASSYSIRPASCSGHWKYRTNVSGSHLQVPSSYSLQGQHANLSPTQP